LRDRVIQPPKSARANDRPALRGVLLQALRGGQLDVVGTDGRWLARWRMPARMLDDAKPSGCIIEPASIKPLCAWLDTHSDELVRIDLGPVAWRVAEARPEDSSAFFAFAAHGADQYPRYDQVIPDNAHGKGAPIVGFDGALLSEVVEAFRVAANAKRGRAVPLMFQFGAKAYDPAIVTCPSAPDMIAVVMPLMQLAVGQYSLTTERA